MIEYRSSRTRSEWHEVAVPARYPGAREALRGNVRGMATAPVTLERVTRMTVASVYPLYLAKLERKGRTKPELDEVITWLTGFDEATIAQLVRDEVIDMPRAFDLLAGAPARLLGVEAGELREGYEADIALVDPEKPWVVSSAPMAASAGNTPFDGQPAQGRVTALFKGGVRI